MIEYISNFILELNITSKFVAVNFGWILLLVTAFLLSSGENSSAKAESAPILATVTGAAALLWFLGVVTNWFIIATTPFIQAAIIFALDGLNLEWRNGSIFHAWFSRVDSTLQPATGNFILATTIIFCAIITQENPKRIKSIFEVIFISALLIANSRIVLALLADPLLLIPVAGFALGAKSSLTGKSSVFNIIQGNIHRGLAIKDIENIIYKHDASLRLLFISLVSSAFWYPVTISSDIQIAFYSAAIGGLMAVIGFAALLFTFSYEQVRASRVRRDLAKNTSEFQSASLPVVIASIFGLVTATGDISFSAAGISLEQAIRSALALCAFSGLVISTWLIMRTFREFTLGIANLKRGDAIANVYVEESLADATRASSSAQPRGLLEFANLLEDHACNVVRINGVSRGALMSSRRSILILPPSKTNIPDAVISDIAMFVSNGGILLVLTDPVDWGNKLKLLKSFSFPSPVERREHSERPVICLRPGTTYGRISGAMSDRLSFRFGASVVPIVGFSVTDFVSDQDPIAPVVAKGFQYGWIVVATSLKPFENSTISTSNDSRFATEFLEVLVSLFPIGEENFSREMKSRFAAASAGTKLDAEQQAHVPLPPVGSDGLVRMQSPSPLLPFDGGVGQPLTKDQILEISQRLGLAQGDPLGDANGSRYELPFYPGATLLLFQNVLWAPAGVKRFLLETDTELIPLEGKSESIHRVNLRQAPSLTYDSVLQYIAFFCFFLHGEAGPFFLVDSMATSLIPDEETRGQIQEVFVPPRIIGRDIEGNWLASGTIYYSDTVSHAQFLIRANGFVEMDGDQELKAGLARPMSAPLKVKKEIVH